MKYLPHFAHLLNIRPWEIERLRLDEFAALCRWVDSEMKARGGGGD